MRRAWAALAGLMVPAVGLWLGCEDDPAPVCSGEGCAGSDGEGGSGGALHLECPASGVLYGPWSLRLDQTSAVVRWDNCRENSTEVSVEPEGGGSALTFTGEQRAAEVTTVFRPIIDIPPDVPGTYYLTEVALTGLEPGTCYRYELAAEPSRSGRVCTARPPGEPFRFLALGDTNASLGDTQGVFSNVLPEAPDFALHTGDLQLYASVLESWASWMPLMAPLFEHSPFLPCLGNHEYEIDGEFDDYYVRYFGGAGLEGTVDYYRYQSGGVWFFSLNTEIELGAGSAQAQWLEQQLAQAAGQPGYRFSVVYLHKPMMTLADYTQQRGEREHFEPIFQQRGVRLILQGHVHGYERFVDGELTYITTGGGGAALHDLDDRIDDRPEEAALRVARAERYHAVVFEVGATELTGTAISHEGEVLDQFVTALTP